MEVDETQICTINIFIRKIKKEKKFQISNLSSHLRELGKEEQCNPKASRKRNIKRYKQKTMDIKTTKQKNYIEKSMKQKLVFEKINKI